MTNQIDELMALADVYADWAEAKGKGHPTYAESRQALQSALEAALKPGEPVTRINLKDGKYLKLEPIYLLGPVAWLLYSENSKPIRALDHYEAGFVNAALNAAPPAQKPPPRLTEGQVKQVIKSLGWLTSDIDILRDANEVAVAIESVVRRQFGVQE